MSQTDFKLLAKRNWKMANSWRARGFIISIVCKNVCVVRTMHNRPIRFQNWTYFEIRFALNDPLFAFGLDFLQNKCRKTKVKLDLRAAKSAQTSADAVCFLFLGFKEAARVVFVLNILNNFSVGLSGLFSWCFWHFYQFRMRSFKIFL